MEINILICLNFCIFDSDIWNFECDILMWSCPFRIMVLPSAADILIFKLCDL